MIRIPTKEILLNKRKGRKRGRRNCKRKDAKGFVKRKD